MLTASNRLTEREIVRLQETAAEGRKTWAYLALAAGLIAMLLAIGFAILIARPIRQLDLAIRQMGTADFTHAVEVNGPQDMRYLGQRLEWLRTRLREFAAAIREVSGFGLARPGGLAAVGPRLRILLFVVFGLFAFLGATSMPLATPNS